MMNSRFSSTSGHLLAGILLLSPLASPRGGHASGDLRRPHGFATGDDAAGLGLGEAWREDHGVLRREKSRNHRRCRWQVAHGPSCRRRGHAAGHPRGGGRQHADVQTMCSSARSGFARANRTWNTVSAARDVANATDDQIRLFHVPHQLAISPRDNVQASWQVCSPKTAAGFSAVGLLFRQRSPFRAQATDWSDRIIRGRHRRAGMDQPSCVAGGSDSPALCRRRGENCRAVPPTATPGTARSRKRTKRR